MILSELDKESINLTNDIDRIMENFEMISNSFNPQINYSLPMASLSRAYSDGEPDYTDSDLIWQNPNYDPSR